MFSRLAAFFQRLGRHHVQQFSPEDPRVAATALLFHVMDADGEEQLSERKKLVSILREYYHLSSSDLRNLIEAGHRAQLESIDLFYFSNTLKNVLTRDERLTFVSFLWQMAYADGYVDELEDSIVWRIAELLGIGEKDQIELRKYVMRSIRKNN